MEDSIAFPNIGIYLEHVGRFFRIGNFTIAYYGVCVACGMIMGILVIRARARATGQNADDYTDLAVWTLLCGIVGARLYYVVFSWEDYREDLLSILRIREGGLAIYGGLIAGTLTLFFLSKKKGIAFGTLLDTGVLGLPIGQILGRWGNFFNREAFGEYTDWLLAMRLPSAAVRQNEITSLMREHAYVIDGTEFIQVHPTFLYEGLWNLGVFALLYFARNKTRFKGELFLLYMGAYGTGRFFIESLRTDQLLLPGSSVPVSMVVSAGAAASALLIDCILCRRHKKTNRFLSGFFIIGPLLILSVTAAGTEVQAESFADTESVLEAGADAAESILEGMSTDEKICQLFVISPEALTGADLVTAAGSGTEEAIRSTPVAGLIYMASNLENSDQIREMLANTQKYSMERTGLPMLLAVDEEGGTVRRINGRGITGDADIPSMRELGESADPATARGIGMQMGSYLSALGFNVDFAPVADVLTNPDNNVVRERSFGSDPELTAVLAVSVMDGLHEHGVAATMKHFPGHGSTSDDSHEGYACSWKTEEELFSCDLIPFQAGIDKDVDLIMAGHISLPNVTGDMIPASLNGKIITSILREKMHYDGVVITDALNMGAVTEHYDSAEASVLALEAGCDLILMPSDWHAAREGVREAVEEGRITEERLDESVRRVICLKLTLSSGLS